MLKPLTVKNFQLSGGFPKSVPATDVGRIMKRGPDRLMNSAARALFNGVRNPFTRERKYQTRLGSSNATEANCMLGTKEARELIIRAFSDACQTRTWNLMIDVIAQGGRYPSNASTLAGFLVEGEQHYWVHVAIDRFTGQVIDKQVEVVNE